MSTADSSLMAAVDDIRGRHLAVYHNAGQIRLEVGEGPHRTDVDLSIEAARVIVHALADASIEARLWELKQAATDTAELEEYRRP
jgi:hypothetical protein